MCVREREMSIKRNQVIIEGSVCKCCYKDRLRFHSTTVEVEEGTDCKLLVSFSWSPSTIWKRPLVMTLLRCRFFFWSMLLLILWIGVGEQVFDILLLDWIGCQNSWSHILRRCSLSSIEHTSCDEDDEDDESETIVLMPAISANSRAVNSSQVISSCTTCTWWWCRFTTFSVAAAKTMGEDECRRCRRIVL